MVPVTTNQYTYFNPHVFLDCCSTPHTFPISLSLPHGPDSSPASFAASMHDRTSLECGALG